MSRRSLDILVPIGYILAIMVAIAIGDTGGVGGVAIIGAVAVLAYFGAVRQNIKT